MAHSALILTVRQEDDRSALGGRPGGSANGRADAVIKRGVSGGSYPIDRRNEGSAVTRKALCKLDGVAERKDGHLVGRAKLAGQRLSRLARLLDGRSVHTTAGVEGKHHRGRHVRVLSGSKARDRNRLSVSRNFERFRVQTGDGPPRLVEDCDGGTQARIRLVVNGRDAHLVRLLPARARKPRDGNQRPGKNRGEEPPHHGERPNRVSARVCF